MKKSELHQLVQETVNEVITSQTQKDPALMSPQEKKIAIDTARKRAGTADQTAPVDLVKKEGMVKEMARTAIEYKLADDYQEKLQSLLGKYPSPKQQRWINDIINSVSDTPASIGDIARKNNFPQQRYNGWGMELAKAGVIVPAGIRGQETPPDQPIIPQHMRTYIGNDGEETASAPQSLQNLSDPEDLFIGGGFDDDFETGHLNYDITDPTSMEPEASDGVETSNSRGSGLSIQNSEVLDQYDNLVRSVSNLRGALRTSGDGGEFGDRKASARSFANQHEILARKRQELAVMLRQHGGMIQQYRDLGKLKKLIKQDDSELPAEFGDIELDETTKSRLAVLANIKK